MPALADVDLVTLVTLARSPTEGESLLLLVLEGWMVEQKKDADYIFHELTRSICPECKQVIDAQVPATR